MKTRSTFHSGSKAFGSGLGLLAPLLLALNAPGGSVDITAGTEIFIRSISPDATHEADLISVRKFSGEVRYGVIQFDLSPLAGQVISGAELILDEIGTTPAGTDANFPLVSAAYLIGTGTDVPNLAAMTWNTYQATYEGQETGMFGALGAYNLAANGAARASRSTYANTADVALLQGIANGSGATVLTLVLKAVNLNNAHAFGDGQVFGNKAILRVTTGANEPPSVTSISSVPSGTTNLPINSTVTLTATVAGTGPLTYQWQKNHAPVGGATDLELVLSALEPAMAGDYALAVSGPGGAVTSAVVSVTVDALHAVNTLAASEDVWIRDIGPTATYNHDFVEVRRTIDTTLNGVIEVRYGLVQFDLSSLAGVKLTSVELVLDELGTGEGAGSGARAPVQTLAFAIATNHNAPDLLSMTWNTYAGTYEGQEPFAFGALGVYDLPANGAARANRSSVANASDLAFVQSLVNTTNALTLVLKPASPGTNVAHAFGDGESAGHDAWLRIVRLVATNPPVVSSIAVAPGAEAIPVGRQTTLSVTATGTGTLGYQWRWNGQAVTGGTGTALVLNAIQPSQAGEYTVVVTDLVGSITSAPVSLTVDASAQQIECAEDVWIRDADPDKTYNGDFLDVRRAGEVRYGLVQFNLGAFAGKKVTGVELILDELSSAQGVGSSATMPIVTEAFAIGTTNNAPNLLAITWNVYQGSFEFLEDFAFTSLGVYDLPANGSLRADRSSFASSADAGLVQRLVDTGTPLTLVLKPTRPGYSLAHSFGDAESGGNNARLVIRTGSVWVSPITVDPGASNVPVGRTVTLSGRGGGVGGWTYQWQRNGQPIADATNTTLVLSAIQPSAAGDYTLVVADTLGRATSAVAALTVDASALEMQCAQTVWIRDVDPDKTYSGEFLDVRRTTEIRYGLVQFDLSPFAGRTLGGAELILDELGTGQNVGSSATLPIQTLAFAIGTSNNAPDLTATTWNTYLASCEGKEDFAFATLGAYNLAPNGSLRTNRSSVASAADLAPLQRLLNATNLFTLVLKPANPGYNLAHSFGDGVAGGNRARLVLRAGLPGLPRLTASRSGTNLVLSWPASAVGWTLQSAPALTPGVTWTSVPGTAQTNQYCWPIGSGACYFRLAN